MPEEPATPGERDDSSGRASREDDFSSGRWRQHAGFSIFFDSHTDDAGQPIWQIRLYHDESGDETTVRGGAVLDWVRWIADRVGPVVDLPDVGGGGTGTVVIEIKIMFGVRAP